jgi:predicted DNA-binding transcriptional regulator AlpA
MAATQIAGDAPALVSGTATSVPESLKQFDSLPDSAHVQLRIVAAVVGVSESTVWRMVKRETLPKPKKVSQRASRWNVGELRRAIAA